MNDLLTPLLTTAFLVTFVRSVVPLLLTAICIIAMQGGMTWRC